MSNGASGKGYSKIEAGPVTVPFFFVQVTQFATYFSTSTLMVGHAVVTPPRHA